jgi:hypothetical protein
MLRDALRHLRTVHDAAAVIWQKRSAPAGHAHGAHLPIGRGSWPSGDPAADWAAGPVSEAIQLSIGTFERHKNSIRQFACRLGPEERDLAL